VCLVRNDGARDGGREFTPEYKDEVVRLVINTGRPVAVVARELGIVEQTLGNWVKAYRARHEAGDEALTASRLSRSEPVTMAVASAV
jgi:transposase-like protein